MQRPLVEQRGMKAADKSTDRSKSGGHCPDALFQLPDANVRKLKQALNGKSWG